MKVLHVIPSIAPVRGGPSQAIIEMVKALVEEGVEVEIATTNDNGPTLLDVPTDGWIDYQRLTVRFFSRFSPPLYSIREFAFSSHLTQWLWQHVSDYDLIHIHAIFSYPATAAMAIARSRRVPYIVRPLGQLCEWSLQQSALKKQLYLKLIEQTNLNHSQGLHLTSEQEKREAAKLKLVCPSYVVPHGLDFSPILKNARQRLRSQFGLPEDEKIILFLSRLHSKKGLDYLTSALGRIAKYPFTFILAGSGDPAYEIEVKAMLKAAGIESRTILPGFVKGKTKDLLLQGADIYALTSHSENFGVAVLEALAAGLSTVVTPGIALSEEIERYQLGYVSELDQGAIAKALERCLNSPEASAEVGQRAQQFVLENYTWKRNADNLIKVYGDVLKEQPGV